MDGAAIAAVVTWARRRGGYDLGDTPALPQTPAGEDPHTFARQLVAEWRLAGRPYTDGRVFVDEDYAFRRSR